ncbi:alpha/beta fold hydrolase, partial [bacterium]
MRSKDFTIQGLRQRLYTWGSPKRPKLFLLHGWLDTGAGFQFLAERLQDRFHCIAPDMRGYGKSGHTRNPLGYFFHEYVADAHALFVKLSPKEPIRLLGHSLGGMVASVYAGSFPERVAQLINVEGYLVPDRPPQVAPDRVRDWIEGLGKKRFRIFPSLRAFAGRLRQANPHLTEERALFLSKYLAKRTARGFTMAAERIRERDMSLSDALDTLGTVLMTEIGGSMGPLYGVMFTQFAEAIGKIPSIDARTFSAMLTNGLDGVQSIGSAQVGDKTLLDALVPAIAAFNGANAAGKSFAEALDDLV